MAQRVRPALATVSLLLVAAVLLARAASAQSLGDVAKKEETRRKTVKSGKVYTNDTLRPDQSTSVTSSQPAAAPAGQTAAAPSPSGGAAGSDEKKTDEPKKDEAYWRQRIQAEREALRRAQLFADALQSRINGLTTDFTARDDPAQRSTISSDRQKSLAELERVKQEIQQRTKAIADIQEEARRAGVPPGWVR